MFGKSTTDLCQAVADLARLLCTEENHRDCLEEYVACRLIPLDKGSTKDGKPGVMPVGPGLIARNAGNAGNHCISFVLNIFKSISIS